MCPPKSETAIPIAIVHQPSPCLKDCELTFLPAQGIDLDRAARQHRRYGRMLQRCGLEVIVLNVNADRPDSVFIEDTAIVLDELAIMTSMGASSRRPEIKAVETVLRAYRQTVRITPPATIEGGDVLAMGKVLFVGRSTRTNTEGVTALEALVAPRGYRVRPVAVTGCLHLKTGCSALDDDTVLINPEWVDPAPFAGFERIRVPPREPFGANVLRLGATICLPTGMPRTREMVMQRGYHTDVTDISEFMKAEAGLTCMSLVFDPSPLV
ncbi:MAG: arginine deiminase family protein [Desulfobacterales bacterium]|nr:arginine deiminase family protein [Desulfobacterales bacterium]